MELDKVKSVMAEWLKGKPRQARHSQFDTWTELPDYDYAWLPSYEYRIKPELKRRSLTSSDLPTLFWARRKKNPDISYLPTAITEIGFRLYPETSLYLYEGSLMTDWEYSPDRKNWFPFYKETQDD